MGKIISIKFLLVLIILVASLLRLYKLSVNPPSLFGDELDLGYQAYSILKTGRDYQGNFMPIHFHSIAEWRTPLYLYSAVPTVAVFGISPLGVRLPAAIFGILSVLVIYFLANELVPKKFGKLNLPFGILPAVFLAISPWHIQYSRAGFEVTLLLFLLLLGVWLFLKSLKNGKWLWPSVICLTVTPLVYSTAKLFTPALMILLFILYRKEILTLAKKHLIFAAIGGLIIGIPIIYSTVFGGGTQRFNYISVFSDPTTIPEVGFARQNDARVRGEMGEGLTPNLIDRLIHNKFTFWGDTILKNYLRGYSTDFLFIKGDPDPRHSVGIGELYRIELIALILGFSLFFLGKENDKKVKILILFWLLAGVIPSAITRDGGNHATRLILILPPIIFLVSYGWFEMFRKVSGRNLFGLASIVCALYLLSISLYIHEYLVHYPWYSERWWHAGWTPAVKEIKAVDKDYDRVIISMSGEPAWIFFAANYEFDPATWQKEYPIGNDVEVPGFGSISHIQKFYFGSPDKDTQIYGLGRYIDSKTLYLANAKEVGANLIMEPNRVPEGLKLLKAVPFPSGEPAFYLFAGTR